MCYKEATPSGHLESLSLSFHQGVGTAPPGSGVRPLIARGQGGSGKAQSRNRVLTLGERRGPGEKTREVIRAGCLRNSLEQGQVGAASGLKHRTGAEKGGSVTTERTAGI